MSEVSRYLRDTAKVGSIESRLAVLETKTQNLGTVTDDYKGYIYINELRRAGETDDNMALQRAKVAQLSTGFPIFFRPAMGSGTTKDDGIDRLTNLTISVRFRAQNGDYLIDSWSQASNTSTGVTPALTSPSVYPNPNDSGNMWANMNLIGIRGQSRVRRGNINKPFIFTCNPVNGSGTTVNGEDEQSYVYKNMRIYGLSLVSNVQSEGFSEYQAQIQVNAVDVLLVDNCDIFGHRGDGIQVGIGHVANGTQNRHSRFVTIRDTLIDGANQNNRNPITICDMDTILIDNVRTVQCGKSGKTFTGTPHNDFNPNSGNPVLSSFLACQQNGLVTTSILRHVITRGCTATDGGAAGIAWFFNDNTSSKQAVNPVQCILAEGNTFKRLKGGLVTAGSFYAGAEYHAQFINNTVVDCRFPFQIAGMNGINLTGNSFVDCDRNGEIGTEPVGGSEYVRPGVYALSSHVQIVNNTFRRVGWANLGAFSIIGTTGRISYNLFEDCGGADFSWRGPGVTSNLTIDQNEVINTNPTSPAMTLTMPVYDFSAQPAPNTGKPDIRGESVFVTYHPSNNLNQTGLVAIGARVERFPRNTSAWRNGASVTTKYDMPRGEVRTIRKSGTFGGTGGLDRWTVDLHAGAMPILTTVVNGGYIAPAPDDSKGSPAAIVIDDNNRLTCTQNGESYWKQVNGPSFSPTYGSPWVNIKIGAPSMITGGVTVGFTHYTNFPEQWVAQNLTFGVFKFGVFFDGGTMQLVVAGARGATIPFELVKPIIGDDRMFLNVQMNIMYNVNTGEGRVSIIHPDTKAERIIATVGGSATGQSIWTAVRMTTANESVRLYN